MFFCIQIPQDMQDVTVRQLKPMSISVQPGCVPSAKDAVNKDNPLFVVQKNAAEQDLKKTKTIQYLLSDWRTAYTKSKKVISFIFLEHII